MHINLSINGEQTTDKALINSGAVGIFADKRWIRKRKLKPRRVAPLIPKNADRTTNQRGIISEAMSIDLGIPGFPEKDDVLVTMLGKEDIILGMPWLKKHNQTIN